MVEGPGAQKDHPGPQLPRIFWASPSIQSLPLEKRDLLCGIHQSVWKCSTRHYLGFNGYQLSTVWKISERNAKLQCIQAYSYLTRIFFFHAWEMWGIIEMSTTAMAQISNNGQILLHQHPWWEAGTNARVAADLHVYLHKFALVWC